MKRRCKSIRQKCYDWSCPTSPVKNAMTNHDHPLPRKLQMLTYLLFCSNSNSMLSDSSCHRVQCVQ